MGKALSKDPRQRFATCREFVERLSHRGSATLITMPERSAAPRAAGTKSAPRPLPPGEEPSMESARGDSVHDGNTVVFTPPTRQQQPAPDRDR